MEMFTAGRVQSNREGGGGVISDNNAIISKSPGGVATGLTIFTSGSCWVHRRGLDNHVHKDNVGLIMQFDCG